MTTYFITRHPGAVQWAIQTGLHYDVHLPHLLSVQSLQQGDVVIGTLPINIVYQLNQQGVRYIHLSLQIPLHLRGVELDVVQLEQCQATLEEFNVQKCSFYL